MRENRWRDRERKLSEKVERKGEMANWKENVE